MESYRILIDEKDLPKKWYNIAADIKDSLVPPINPQTKEVLKPEDMSAIFPDPLIEQEMSTERWIKIPDEVLDIYRFWRPTPLVRAFNLEKSIGTPAKIYYKNESVSPPGSHKPNTSVPQAYYNKIFGTKRLATETGAGQWGSALAFACNFFDLETIVYMVKVSYEQKPYRKSMMQAWGAEVVASPSDKTESGRKILAKDPDSPGSLGIAISEAVEDAVVHEDTKYTLGSVANHVMLHQSIIGLEAQKQMEKARDYPDIVIGCHGGGSNFAGLAFPFLKDKISGMSNIKFLAVEPCACPTLTKGKYLYDYGDTAGLTPLYKMYTLGHSFIPSGIHAGGLRYHGSAPLVSSVLNKGFIEAKAYHQKTCFEAAIMFAKTEGFIPAPESSHAIRAAIDEAIDCKKTGESKTILFNLSGHGLVDMYSYDKYFKGQMHNFSLSQEEIDKSIKSLPLKEKV